jgi:hypothetical protein
MRHFVPAMISGRIAPSLQDIRAFAANMNQGRFKPPARDRLTPCGAIASQHLLTQENDGEQTLQIGN